MGTAGAGIEEAQEFQPTAVAVAAPGTPVPTQWCKGVLRPGLLSPTGMKRKRSEHDIFFFSLNRLKHCQP